MKFLLEPVFEGEIELIGCHKETILEFFKIYFPNNIDKWYEYNNPINNLYCESKINVWAINNKLKEGYVLIGTEGPFYLMTKKKNIKK